YTPNEMHRLIIAIELCELGVPPATTASLINRYWDSKFKPICRDAEENNPAIRSGVPIESSDDIVLYCGGMSLRTGSLKGAKSPRIPKISCCRMRDLPRHIAEWMGPDNKAPRALIVNLSARLRSFHAALAESWMDDEVRSERTGAKVKKA